MKHIEDVHSGSQPMISEPKISKQKSKDQKYDKLNEKDLRDVTFAFEDKQILTHKMMKSSDNSSRKLQNFNTESLKKHGKFIEFIGSWAC